MIMTLASLLMLMSCGSGDKMPATRTNPLDLVTGEAGPSGGAGGGGGGGTGACVVESMVCYQGMDSPTCDMYASLGATINFVAGGSCAALGFPTCSPPIGGISQCTNF
jgi:hypothetical protein